MGPVARDPGTERVRVDAAMPIFVIDGVDLLKTSNYFLRYLDTKGSESESRKVRVLTLSNPVGYISRYAKNRVGGLAARTNQKWYDTTL